MFRDLKINIKLYLLLTIPIITLFISGYLGLSSMNSILNGLVSSIYSRGYVGTALILNADRDMYQALVAQRSLLLTDSHSPEFQKLIKSHKENIDQTKERVDKAKRILEADKQNLNQFKHEKSQKTIFENFDIFESKFNEWVSLSNSLLEAISLAPVDKRLGLFDLAIKSDKVFNDSRECINEIGELLEAYSEYNITQKSGDKEDAEYYIVIIDILSVFLLLVLSHFVIRSIINPVNQLVKITNTISSGNLTIDIPVQSKNEIGKLAESFRAMVKQMREILGTIAEKSTQVAASAGQMALSAQQTAAGANENAATMGQISVTVQRFTENTGAISDASSIATRYASQGSSDINRIAGQMEQIYLSSHGVSQKIDRLYEKSQEINQIVEMITSIADQTNLLALNAAIEAARAGEQGRGFAVVADEVRKLAEQSSSAAKEIMVLVKAIQVESRAAVESVSAGSKEVEYGTKVAKEVGTGFNEIISAVQGLSSQIQEVASATEEMSSGVQSVAASTEQQTASMEEVSATAESLSRLAVELNALVKRFKI